MPTFGSVYLRDISGNVASIDTSGNVKMNLQLGTATFAISGSTITQAGTNFVTGSGLIVSCTSGGVALAASLLSNSVTIKYTGSGRVFVGSSGFPPVGSGTTDQQRVGFPIVAPYSGVTSALDTGTTITISNPSFLRVSAEFSGGIAFYAVNTPF